MFVAQQTGYDQGTPKGLLRASPAALQTFSPRHTPKPEKRGGTPAPPGGKRPRPARTSSGGSWAWPFAVNALRACLGQAMKAKDN